MMNRHLWLVGMMGSGKSRVGPGLAERLHLRFVDTDEEISERIGCSIAQFWGERGEEAFRDMEAATIARVAEEPAAVVAAGGGAVLREGNVAAMRESGRVVWLTASPPTLVARVGSGSDRPLLREDATEARLAGILDSRSDLYAHAAHVAVDTEDADPTDVINRIEVWWNASS
jgi:shikimate kinase